MHANKSWFQKHFPILAESGLWASALIGLYLASLHSYLLFHGIVEVFGIAVACAVFLLAWNARTFMEESHLLFLGAASLGIAMLELLHTLAYKGMGVFPGEGPNLPTQLWMASRFLQAAAFLALPWVIGRRVEGGLLLAGGLATAGALAALIFSGHFPDCYLEGQGLTTFKIIGEYLGCLALLTAGWALWRRRQGLHPRELRFLLASLGFSLAQGLAFSLYAWVYGQANLLGHLLGILATLMLYKAVIETGLRNPMDVVFTRLRASEQELRRSRETARILLNAPHEAALLLDRGLKVLALNQLAAKRLGGGDPESLVGRDYPGLLSTERAEQALETLARVINQGAPLCREAARGQRIYADSLYPIFGEDGRVEQLALYSRDVTERRRHEAERERLLTRLTAARDQVKTLSELLPICANCKRVRDDQGYWERIEAYIGRQSGATVTHGLCPDCAHKLYPELYT